MHDYPDVFALTEAQIDEMEKIALSAGVGRAIGAGVGALGGAGVGYATGQTPEEKKRRALLGAVVGGVGGVLPGQFLTGQGRRQASRFGQRQLHGATGLIKHDGKWVRSRNLNSGQRVEALKDVRWTLPDEHVKDKAKALENLKVKIKDQAKEPGMIFDKSLKQRFLESGVGKKWRDSKTRNFLLNRRISAERSQRGLAEADLTNIPGLAEGYLRGAKAPGGLTRGQILKSNLTAPGLAVGVGVPAVFAAPELAQSVKERDPRRAARTLAETAGWSVAGGLPTTAAMGVGTGASMLAGKVFGQPGSPQQGAAQNTAGRVVQQGEVPRLRRAR